MTTMTGEQFFERFDEICALANDGTGMTAPERLVSSIA
jgi:hypothetical protein